MGPIQTNLDIGTDKTLQDFRNELQEISFKELHRMNIHGDTSGSNVITNLLRILDDDYGTEYQVTESTRKAWERK